MWGWGDEDNNSFLISSSHNYRYILYHFNDENKFENIVCKTVNKLKAWSVIIKKFCIWIKIVVDWKVVEISLKGGFKSYWRRGRVWKS